MSAFGGRYRVWSEGKELQATLRGRLKQGEDRVVVGDEVLVELQPDGSATIERVEPRRSALKRRTPGKLRGVRVVAANLDQVAVVGSVARPDWDCHLMDRFIAVAEANRLPVLLVINKADLGSRIDELAAPYRDAGYRVVITSVPQQLGLDEFKALLSGRVTVVTGPTGVGKSSLLNAIQPGLRLRTGEVGRKGGRHTTVAAEMHRLEGGGFVVDTPGLRDIGLWGLSPEEVEMAFPELAEFAGGCRFDNCRHMEEPGCAVVEAAAQGKLSGSRLASYRKLLAEAQAAARPWG
ncbi:MAG: putative ribosome biogenesis GTPase RsgA [Gemmatimonadales bacterium]|nr:MAG: putative ribosome biogenesis GTPase RsgA [Gemmatimonadales bacterium]